MRVDHYYLEGLIMKTGTATYQANMFAGACRHEFTVLITGDDDGGHVEHGDVRRWVVSSRGEGVDIAERAGIRVNCWELVK
jgi:hypothetical protein